MIDCRPYRDAIHRRLDGELTTLDREALDAHLVTCKSCREASEDLEALSRSLLAVPQDPMPPEVLDAVWERTVRSRRAPLASPWARWTLGAAAAAAAVALILSPLILRWTGTGAAVSTPVTTAQLERAEHDAHFALALASRAIRRTETAARDRVLAAEVAPALRKIPFRRPEPSPAPARRDRT